MDKDRRRSSIDQDRVVDWTEPYEGDATNQNKLRLDIMNQHCLPTPCVAEGVEMADEDQDFSSSYVGELQDYAVGAKAQGIYYCKIYLRFAMNHIPRPSHPATFASHRFRIA
jgi:hypothetical protein